MQRRVLFLVFVFCFCFALPTTAKGSFSRVTIEGPTLAEPIVVTDDRLALALLSVNTFEDFTTRGSQNAPEGIVSEPTYTITREFEEGTGNMRVFDVIEYFENVDPTLPGYVRVFDRMGDRTMTGRWQAVRPQGFGALQQIVAGEPVTCPENTLDSSMTVSEDPFRIGRDPFWFGTFTVSGFRGEGATPTPTAELSVNLSGELTVNTEIVTAFYFSGWSLNSMEPVRFRNMDWHVPEFGDGGADWPYSLHAVNLVEGENGQTTLDWDAYLPSDGCYEFVIATVSGLESVRYYLDVGNLDV